MTLEQIYTMLTATGYPVAFYDYPEPTGEIDPDPEVDEGTPEPPYLVYLTPFAEPITADGIVVMRLATVQVELYTWTKDTDAEAAVEAVLKANRIAFEKSEIGIPAEGLYKVKYEFDNVEG